ncbi:MAG: SprT-like domain-containing protein [Akkermansiaceae bacterium]|nr:SprT-like domain-containing protein [Akkermansiaceae bacterium]
MKPIEQMKLNIALLDAAQCEDGAEDIRRLLAAGADMNTEGEQAWPDVAELKHADGVRAMLEFGADVYRRNSWGDTALHLAALRGCAESVRLLLDAGVPPDIKSSRGVTPFFYAFTQLQVECVQLLLERGADANATDEAGHKAWQFITSVRPKRTEKILPCLRLLEKFGAPLNPEDQKAREILCDAISDGEIELATYLLSIGVSPQSTNEYGVSALHLAAEQENPAFLRLLLDAGADMHCLSKQGATLLHTAAGRGRAENIRLLLAAGADVNARDKHNRTPLHEVKGLECIKLLVKAGADVNARDNSGDSMLYDACDRYEFPLALYLLKLGVKPTTKRERSKLLSCLQGMMQYRIADFTMPDYWLNCVDINEKNQDGNTLLIRLMNETKWPTYVNCYNPFDSPRVITLKEYRHHLHKGSRDTYAINSAILYLVEVGADLNVVNKRGQSAMDIAAVHACADVAHTLRAAGAKFSYELGNIEQQQWMERRIHKITPIALPEPDEWHSVDDMLAYARRCTTLCGLTNWQWTVEKTDGAWLGRCCVYSRTLMLASKLLSRSHREIREVIIHELAHAMDWVHHTCCDIECHNLTWKLWGTALGMPGMTVHSSPDDTSKMGLEGITEAITTSSPHLLCHRETGEVFHVYKARPKLTAMRLAKMCIRGREEETRGKLCVSAIPAERGERTLFAECSEDGKTIFNTSKEIPRMTERRLRDTHAQGRRLCYLLTLENMVDYECA